MQQKHSKIHTISKFKVLLKTSIISVFLGMFLGCTPKKHGEASLSTVTNCPTFESESTDKAPIKIQFTWTQSHFEGYLIGCGNSGVAYKFEHPDGPKVVKFFYANQVATSYPEMALFVDRHRDIMSLAPNFAQHIVPTLKASINYKNKLYKTLIKSFVKGVPLLSAPNEVINQFFTSYRDLHAKSLGMRCGKFYITDLHPENIIYDGKKLWIIDGSLGSVPLGRSLTFNYVCAKQAWCQSRN